MPPSSHRPNVFSSSWRGSEILYRALRPLLFALEPETAHELTLVSMRLVQPLLRPRSEEVRPRELWGLRFPNPLGIAAGLDKNGAVVPFLQALGFGFLEVGTVTLLPQQGNLRPRIFRYSPERALVNRLGFNNEGARVVADRLRRWRRTIPLLVNIGKNRDVPLEGVEDHYRECFEILRPVADAVVVNVSSPNTPGLRELQDPRHLERILIALRGERPLLVKIAPDLNSSQLREIAGMCVTLADGIVATNTTTERPGGVGADQEGGLSGAPLFERSTAVVRELRSIVGAKYPIIGVGGIMTADDARAKLQAGADLIETYTGLVYGGPAFPREILRGLR